MHVISIVSSLCLLAAGQGVFLSAVLFFHRRGNAAANRLLAALVLLFSLRLAEFSAYWTLFFLNVPELLFTTSAFQFLFGPLLYLYARTILRSGSRLRWFDPLHAIPFVIHVIYLVPFYLLSAAEKQTVFEQTILSLHPKLGAGFMISESSQIIHLAIYSLAAFFLVTRATIGRSSIATIRTSWLRKMLAGFGIFVFLNLLHFLELAFFGYEYIVAVDLGVMFFQAVFVYAIGYASIRHPEIHANVSSKTDGSRYERSGLTGEQAKDYLYRLTRAMEVDRLYKDSDMSLPILAEKLNLSSHHVSQVLNEQLQMNFYDFLNRYRIEEAKQLLSSSDASESTILAIAMEVGFNTKASFNSAFKKHTRMTPSEFRSRPS